MNDIARHPIVSRADWLVVRKRHLEHEKELTRMRDRLAEERRALPWVKLDKTYTFDTPQGPRLLADLFGTNSQLFVYHFMLPPGAAEGCPGCSFLADHLEGAVVHLEHHDVSVVMVSRASLDDIRRYQQRMGWNIRWVSSAGTDFNHDFHVSFTPEQVASGQVDYNYRLIEPWGEDAHGMSAFCKDERGDIFHTYSAYARGAETLLATYAVLDVMPKGRNETSANGQPMDWVRRHDRYDNEPQAKAHCCA
jgi:predicted dithiol-disulfide oxidoreductase (DUF899 family)